MKYSIKSSYTDNTIFEDEATSFSALVEAAVKAKVSLSNANLHSANLHSADLSNANLSTADLHGVDLSTVDLSNANLHSANLHSADLRDANLSYADLSNADLSNADLSNADLNGANLHSANLHSANLRNVKNVSELNSARFSIVPEKGAFIGWKVCRNKVIVKLQILATAKRSNATSRKCRAEKVKVLAVYGAKKGISQHDSNVVYTKRKTVKCDHWNEDRWVECGGGIHFFMTRIEAENY